MTAGGVEALGSDHQMEVDNPVPVNKKNTFAAFENCSARGWLLVKRYFEANF